MTTRAVNEKPTDDPSTSATRLAAKPRPVPRRKDGAAAAEAAGAPRHGLGLVVQIVRDALRGHLHGPHREELIDAQREVILQRTAVLIWISVIVMPTACLTFIYFTARHQIVIASWIIAAAIGTVLLHRVAVGRGWYHKHYHLAMLLLVGGVFGPTGSAIMSLGRTSGGSFLFAFFLIYFAFTALFPADARWIIFTSLAVMGSYVLSSWITFGNPTADPELVNNLIYFGELTFIGVVLNRVLCQLFFDERSARIELRGARDAMFAEMEVAQDIQKLLLPKEPTLPGFVVHGLMNPAAEVGGDYYDVISTDGGRRLVAIGDVSGHGVTTGLTMMMARASLVGTLEARPDAPLATLYQAMNRCLRHNLERMDLRLYMTFALLEDMGGGRFRAVGAHLPALIHRASKKSIEEVELAGVWLGVLDHVTPDLVPETEFQLQVGDTMLLMTDGIVEYPGVGKDGMFGFERVHELLLSHAERGPAAIVDELLTQLAAHGPEQDDDVTVLVLRYLGGDVPARA